ncbi:hypothetical protein GCM10010994_56920 [Chelatococcus reniformis]|uniref:Uncharacterized protein n=1 Tax=Chelatococcus reniformis TaxID=1494448 RepID=A0A916UXM1_9HYPH|nr:hypothetical protein GCM10010994_56920 [Chelatococcus reniformis]
MTGMDAVMSGAPMRFVQAASANGVPAMKRRRVSIGGLGKLRAMLAHNPLRIVSRRQAAGAKVGAIAFVCGKKGITAAVRLCATRMT